MSELEAGSTIGKLYIYSVEELLRQSAPSLAIHLGNIYRLVKKLEEATELVPEHRIAEAEKTISGLISYYSKVDKLLNTKSGYNIALLKQQYGANW